MATLALQKITTGSNNPSYVAAAAGGDEFPFLPNVFFGVKNGDASPHTVTIAANTTSLKTGVSAGTLTISDIVVSVPAGGERIIGVPAAYAASGVVSVTYDAVTSMTVAAQYVSL